VLRQALFGWAFNLATRHTDPPPQIAAALDWTARSSLPVAALEDTATVRQALGACALVGKPAAEATQRRKRSVFYNALGYAVEQGHLSANPVDRIQWTTQP
jgi:ferric-dicitrate binding protein FerR (iron transport regulator)